MEKDQPKDHFTVGINDDVTFTSIDVKHYGFRTAPEGTRAVVNWGFGGDGSVGAMTSTSRLVAEKTPNNVLLYHSSDSKKEGGATVSHLRIGPT
jgi:pyruvate-ferredoxin/flavodoxin oxidoreductase